MAPTAQSSRCFFLELPAEIRVIIYQELVKLHSEDPLVIRVSKRYTCRCTFATKFTAITRVSHQIRRESRPIIYAPVRLKIHAETKEERYHASHWLNHTVNPTFLAIISKFRIYPVWHHTAAYVEIDLAQPHQPVSYAYCYGCSHGIAKLECKTLLPHADNVQAQLREADMMGDQLRMMTKEVLESLIDTLCATPADLELSLSMRYFREMVERAPALEGA
jgi:hypothetical protein